MGKFCSNKHCRSKGIEQPLSHFILEDETGNRHFTKKCITCLDEEQDYLSDSYIKYLEDGVKGKYDCNYGAYPNTWGTIYSDNSD